MRSVKVLVLSLCFVPAFASAKGSITDLIQKDSRFTILRKLMKTTGMDTSLDGNGISRYTLFAPTDAAFRKLHKEAMEAVMDQDRFGATVMMAHVVKGQYGITSFTNGLSRKGQPLRHHLMSWGEHHIFTEAKKGGGVVVNGANIVGEVHADNGTILIVDTVMPVTIDQPKGKGFERVLPQKFLEWGLGKYVKASRS